MERKRANIAFGIALLAIGYNFLPVKAPEPVAWITAIALLVIGCWILIFGTK